MKKIAFLLSAIFITVSVAAQPVFDLGVKAGLNNSKITFKPKEFTSESILKSHFGAFARIGWGILYVQPEAYFSAKGAEISSNVQETASQYNFNNIDVPVLVGLKFFDGELFNARLMAGPMFSFIVSDNVDGEEFLDPQHYKNNYFGFQYGAGVDISRFFLDLRMEHGANNMYYHPGHLNGKNQTFMVTAGFKIF
jgi:hypothetical protein